MPPTIAQLRARSAELTNYFMERPEELIGGVYGVGLAPSVAGGVAVGEMTKHIAATSAVATQRAFEAGKAAGAGMWGGYGMEPPEAAAVAEFVGPDDEKTCPICLFLLGSKFRVGSSEFFAYQPPVHINCRHTYVYYEATEPEAVVDFEEPPADLVRKHGHFISQPQKYEALRVPGGPSGRDFIARRVKNAEGEVVTRLDWLKQPPQPPTREAREVMVGLLDEAVQVPAHDLTAYAYANGLQPLIEHGWLKVVETRGAPRVTAVSATSVEQARMRFLRERPLAVVDDIQPAGRDEFQLIFREYDQRRIQLTRRGRAAALWTRDMMRRAADEGKSIDDLIAAK